jgi:hypothetical protein
MLNDHNKLGRFPSTGPLLIFKNLNNLPRFHQADGVPGMKEG